jgi:hypothetical protein
MYVLFCCFHLHNTKRESKVESVGQTLWAKSLCPAISSRAAPRLLFQICLKYACTLKNLGDKDQMGLIGTAGFLNNGWPDDIQPLPKISQLFALIHLLQDELEQYLRLHLKLCLIIGESTYGTSSPQWVHLLCVLVQVLAAMVHRHKANPPSGTLFKTIFPLPEIHGACLSQFAEAVRGIYDADLTFASAADELLSAELGTNERRKPMSSNGFVVQFRKEYSALFQWAAVG